MTTTTIGDLELTVVNSDHLCVQIARGRGVAGSLEWSRPGEGGGQGDGGEEERTELDAQVNKDSQL